MTGYNVNYICEKCTSTYHTVADVEKCIESHAYLDEGKTNGLKPELVEETGTIQRTLTYWTDPASELLINLVKSRFQHLNGRNLKRQSVWVEIAKLLQQIIPGISEKQVETKWKNIRQTFLKYEDNKRTPGKGRMKVPQCHELLASFLVNKQLIIPTDIISCGLGDEPGPSNVNSDLDETNMSVTLECPDDRRPNKRSKPDSHDDELDNPLLHISFELKRSNDILADLSQHIKQNNKIQKKDRDRFLKIMEERQQLRKFNP